MNVTLTVGHIVWSACIASAFAFWAIFGKYTGAPVLWSSFAVIAGTFVGGAIMSGQKLSDSGAPSAPSSGILVILFVAGIANGIAMYFYTSKTSDPAIPTTPFVITTIIFMLLMTPVFSYFLNGEVLSGRGLLGVLLAIVTVIVISGA